MEKFFKNLFLASFLYSKDSDFLFKLRVVLRTHPLVTGCHTLSKYLISIKKSGKPDKILYAFPDGVSRNSQENLIV